MPHNVLASFPDDDVSDRFTIEHYKGKEKKWTLKTIENRLEFEVIFKAL